jgi:cytidine deaminase
VIQLINQIIKRKKDSRWYREKPYREFKVDCIIEESNGKQIIEINHVILENILDQTHAEFTLVMTCFSTDKQDPEILKAFFTATIDDSTNLG